MTTKQETPRKPYERPMLVLTSQLNKIVANGSESTHTF